MFRRNGCRSVLDLGDAESSALEIWAIIRNLVHGSGTLIAVEFGRAELENEFNHKHQLATSSVSRNETSFHLKYRLVKVCVAP